MALVSSEGYMGHPQRSSRETADECGKDFARNPLHKDNLALKSLYKSFRAHLKPAGRATGKIAEVAYNSLCGSKKGAPYLGAQGWIYSVYFTPLGAEKINVAENS
jgi:hypothetical protein